MSRIPRDPVVVGVDVGGPEKGFHAVALKDGQFFEQVALLDPGAVVQWSRSLHASAVGIDAPCAWSLTGRARPCEWELAASGIRAFATPSFAVGVRNPFYSWMVNGAELFRHLTPYYHLFNGRPSVSLPVCFETFPQAVACTLAGRILSARHKRTNRRRLLRQAGVSLGSLTTIDQVDAALCALTAHHLLRGAFRTYGDATEGFIIVPVV